MSASLTQVATDLISHLGYTGLVIGLVVDSTALPIPSEVLVPLATVLALHGRFNLWAIFIIGTLSQLVGGLIGYYIGRYGGEPVLEKYGKYVLISKRDLRHTHRAFEKYGPWLTMVGRCIPGIRGVIAFPAGVAEMRVSRFVIFTAIGSAVWTALLMYFGYVVGENLSVIDQLASRFSLIGAIIVLGLVAWHFRHLWWRRGKSDS